MRSSYPFRLFLPSLLPALLLLQGCSSAPRTGLDASSTVAVQKTDAQRLQEARDLLKQARSTPIRTNRLRYALAAAQQTWPLLPGWTAADPDELEIWSDDPAVQIYNEASAVAARNWRKLADDPDDLADTGFQITADAETTQFLQGSLALDELEPASKYKRRALKESKHRPGIGGKMVGVIEPTAQVREQHPFMPPRGYRLPVTAVWDFGEPDRDGTPSAVIVRLRKADVTETIDLENREMALAADLSAPLEALAPEGSSFIAGLIGLINPLQPRVTTGLHLLQPYDPDRIPVIMVHGLQSVPAMWGDLLNDLEAHPEIVEKYQFGVFGYPTGLPIPYNAEQLRLRLEQLEATYSLPKGMILIGHSMGGLLSRMQVTDSNRAIWDTLFGDKADALLGVTPQDDILYQSLIFEADDDVERVIYIATPHRGSGLADNWIGRIGSALVKIPVAGFVVSTGSTVLESILTGRSPVDVAERLGLQRQTPNSVSGLSPESPILLSLDTLEMQGPHHSIIGNIKGDDVPIEQTTDGVVPYWSSHVSSVESEIVLPGGHGIYKNPDATVELIRILKLHLDQQ